jgi:YHYH protein
LGYIDNIQRGTCHGYWPPVVSSSIVNNDGCPIPYSDNISTSYFNIIPNQEISLDFSYSWAKHQIVGRAVNGVLLYNGLSDEHLSEWTILAPPFEELNFDPCSGHASKPSYVYHHHSYPKCLAIILKDDENSHSPLYGFAVDGYPIYGPYQDSHQLAQSCWQLRDYSSTATGCIDGRRSCQLLDEYDYTKGVTSDGVTLGLLFLDQIKSPNGNNIDAVNGIFYEDYFFNHTCSMLPNLYLDQHNGHSHDNLGYHYHMTTDLYGKPVFPYITGPKLYGCVPNYESHGSRCANSVSNYKIDHSCISNQNSLSVISRTLISVAIAILLFLFVIGIIGACCVMLLRRHRRLVPTYEDRVLDVEVMAGLPTAIVVFKPKPATCELVVPVDVASSNTNNDHTIATAVAVPWNLR